MSTSVLSTADAARTLAASEDEVRSAAIEAAIALYRERALTEVALEQAAAAAGLDLADVQERFATLDDLLLAVIGVWHGRRDADLVEVPIELGAVAFLRAVVVANVAEPALMRLMMGAASVSATPGHPIGVVMRQQWVQFHGTVQRALAHDIAIGREPATVEPPHGAEQLIAVYEGLQVQALMRPNMDLLEAYDRAVARLREGWAHASAPLVWEL